MSGDFTLRNIRREDVLEFLDPPIPGIKGVAWELDGETVGIAGIAYYQRILGFSSITDKMRPYLKTITTARGIKTVQKRISECHAPVYAMREADEPTSASLLERLGFVQSEDNEELYQWHS